MVIKGNLTRFDGYLPLSPDGLYPEDTGVVNRLTNPRYTRVNVKKIRGPPARINTTISRSTARQVTTAATNIKKGFKK